MRSSNEEEIVQNGKEKKIVKRVEKIKGLRKSVHKKNRKVSAQKNAFRIHSVSLGKGFIEISLEKRQPPKKFFY